MWGNAGLSLIGRASRAGGHPLFETGSADALRYGLKMISPGYARISKIPDVISVESLFMLVEYFSCNCFLSVKSSCNIVSRYLRSAGQIPSLRNGNEDSRRRPRHRR